MPRKPKGNGRRDRVPPSRTRKFIRYTPDEQPKLTPWDARTALTLLMINSCRVSELASRCPGTEGDASRALANLGLVQRGEGQQAQPGGELLSMAEEAHQIADDLAALIDTLAPLLGLNASEVSDAFHDSV